jgi:hypothetical protein
VRRASIAIGITAALVIVFAIGYWVRGPTSVLPAPSTAAGSPRPGLPDTKFTPGAVNPAVTGDTMGSTICSPGWTATIRPPSAYTSALKVAQILQYGYDDRDPRHYEEDHLVPLELGGAPRDPRNLWPQPMTARLPDGSAIGAGEKDDLEDELKRRVCDNSMPLVEAQRAIAGDWVAAWDAAGRP